MGQVSRSVVDMIWLLARAEELRVANVKRIGQRLMWDCFPYLLVFYEEDSSLTLYVTVPEESGPDAMVPVWMDGQFLVSGPWEQQLQSLVGYLEELVAKVDRQAIQEGRCREEEERREWERLVHLARVLAETWKRPEAPLT